MRARTKVLYLVLVALLAYSAIQLYWPLLQREADHFIEAWQTIRDTSEPEKESEGTEVASAEAPRPEPRRSLLAPTQRPDDPVSTEDPATDEFIRDIRQRARSDPEATLLWLQESHSGGERLRGMLEVVALWAAEDSESTLLWLESNAQGIARMETLHSGVELWARRSPKETAAWVDGMANDGSKTAAARALAKQWASSAPEQAAEWVAELPNGEIAEAASLELVDSWAETDPEAAAVWALTQAEYRGNDRALEQSIENYTKQDPVGAETFVRELAEAYESPAPAGTYARALATGDPAAAAAWFSRLEEGDPIYSSDHATTILKTWAETDSIAASAWLSEQPGGPRRDAAVAGFVETIQRFEPSAATMWAETIESPSLRIQQLETNFSAWVEQNQSEAQAWLESAELEPAVRTGLASLIEK